MTVTTDREKDVAEVEEEVEEGVEVDDSVDEDVEETEEEVELLTGEEVLDEVEVTLLDEEVEETVLLVVLVLVLVLVLLLVVGDAEVAEIGVAAAFGFAGSSSAAVVRQVPSK